MSAVKATSYYRGLLQRLLQEMETAGVTNIFLHQGKTIGNTRLGDLILEVRALLASKEQTKP